MKIFTLFTALLCVIFAVAIITTSSVSFVSADGKNAEDFACMICRDFVKRVVLENESPRTACKNRRNQPYFRPLDGCHFILKEHDLVAKAFDLRSSLSKNADDQSLSDHDLDDICYDFTKDHLCPHSSDTFGNPQLWDDTAGWDIRVAPANSDMNPNSVRITVVDSNFTKVKTHSQAFLNEFSYNNPMQYFNNSQTVHTGVFSVPQNGSVINVNLGGEFILPVKTIKPRSPIRMFLIGDPCFNGKYVTCSFGGENEWKIFSRLTQLLNTLAKIDGALDVWSLLGDNFYCPLLQFPAKFFSQLNPAALGTPFLSAPGNHDIFQWGGCTAGFNPGINTLGSTYIQYWGQNSKAASANPSNPFNFTGFNISDLDKGPSYDNFFQTSLVGNVAFVSFSGRDPMNQSAPFFEQACEWISEVKPSAIILHSHWTYDNCGCSTGLSGQDVYLRLIKMPGCSQFAHKIFSVVGHSHNNEVQYYNNSDTKKGTPEQAKVIRIGGAGMIELSLPGPTFGLPFIDTHNDQLNLWYFPVTDILDPSGVSPVASATLSHDNPCLRVTRSGQRSWIVLFRKVDFMSALILPSCF